jgi:hypothetical protein
VDLLDTHLECGTGEHIEANLKWGRWLKADLENTQKSHEFRD